MRFPFERTTLTYPQWHGPAWRRLAAEALAAGTLLGPERADRQTVELAAYLRLCRAGPHGRQRAARAFPLVAAAEALCQDGAAGRDMQVLVMGGWSVEAIAERLGVDARVVAAWQSLYFDVPDVQVATGWIYFNVILAERTRGGGHQAARLQFAWSQGHFIAGAILEVEARVARGEGVTLPHQVVRLVVKFIEALEVSQEPDRVKRFFLTDYVRRLEREQRRQQGQRRLEERSKEALRRHQLAEERLEQRRQAAADRAERARQRDERRALELGRQAEARSQSRAGRRPAAPARAARSALAQLRWEYVGPPAAAAPSAPGQGAAPGEARVPCGPSVGRCPSPEQESFTPAARTDGARAEPWAPAA